MRLEADIKSYLVDAGQSTSLLRLGRLPPDPDDAVALIAYTGLRPEFVHNVAGISRDRPALQVLVRSKVYATAQATAQAIYELLAGLVNETINTTFYQRCEPLGSPFLMNRDANERAIIAANYYCSRTLAT